MPHVTLIKKKNSPACFGPIYFPHCVPQCVMLEGSQKPVKPKTDFFPTQFSCAISSLHSHLRTFSSFWMSLELAGVTLSFTMVQQYLLVLAALILENLPLFSITFLDFPHSCGAFIDFQQFLCWFSAVIFVFISVCLLGSWTTNCLGLLLLVQLSSMGLLAYSVKSFPFWIVPYIMCGSLHLNLEPEPKDTLETWTEAGDWLMTSIQLFL